MCERVDALTLRLGLRAYMWLVLRATICFRVEGLISVRVVIYSFNLGDLIDGKTTRKLFRCK